MLSISFTCKPVENISQSNQNLLLWTLSPEVQEKRLLKGNKACILSSNDHVASFSLFKPTLH